MCYAKQIFGRADIEHCSGAKELIPLKYTDNVQVVRCRENRSVATLRGLPLA